MGIVHCLGVLAVGFLLLLAPGCGDDDGGSRECAPLCQEGQAGSCTSIKGDCAQFCTALDRVAPDAVCTDERDAYLECLNSKSNVCDASCGGPENALESCLGRYCLGHMADADCQTLTGSF